MRILVLTTTYPRWTQDSVTRFVYDLCHEYVAQGHTVGVLAPHSAGASAREFGTGIEVRRFRYFWPASGQAVAYQKGMLGNLQTNLLALAQLPLFTVSMLVACLRFSREFGPDVIHSHWIVPSGVIGALAAKILGIPQLVTVHAGDVVGLSRMPGRTWIAAAILAGASKVVAVSRYTAGELTRAVGPSSAARMERILDVFPMGVDVEKLKPGRSKRNGLLFIGRLVEKKGIEILIRAFSTIRKKQPDVTLDVCGDGHLRPHLENLARELHLERVIRFHGFVSDDQKRELLTNREILIVPSLVAKGGDIEGLPVVILEGLAAGCCVVASDVAGNGEVIRNGFNGLLVPPGDIVELASAIENLIADDGLREQIRKRAIDSASEFGWGKIGRRYIDLLESVSAMKSNFSGRT